MKTKTLIPISEAIEEAIRFGFRDRLVLKNEMVHSLQTNRNFFENEYAVVEAYPVVLSNGHKGRIQYIVLNNGQLGFLVKESKSMAQQAQSENESAIEDLIEDSNNNTYQS